jgi:hypothetical protein
MMRRRAWRRWNRANRIGWAAALVQILLAGACEVPQQPASCGQPPAQIHFVDSDLSQDICIGVVSANLDLSHLLQVDIPIRPVRDQEVIVDYRVTFFDRNNVELGPPGTWQTRGFKPGGFAHVEFTSDSTRAADFRIDLRYVR